MPWTPISATVLSRVGFGRVASRFFSVSLKVLSQGNLCRRSLQGLRSATTAGLRTQHVVLGFCLLEPANFRITNLNLITYY